MLPGFIDTHLHPTLMVFYDLNLNLSGRPPASSQEKLKRRAGRNREMTGLSGCRWTTGPCA